MNPIQRRRGTTLFSNLVTIYDQEGLALSFGGSTNMGPIGVGVDYNMGLQDDWQSNGYSGYTATATLGLGLPAEVHGTIGETWVIGLNIYDLLFGLIN